MFMLNKTSAIVICSVVLFLPLLSSAEIGCNSSGYTVVFVNGILNSLADAKNSKNHLERELPLQVNGENIKVITGYNPSHLYGLGDIVQAAAQAMNSSVSDHDLATILMQIQPNVTTQKILLVGHSQGTFYTNELYRYLTSHGVPKDAIAVYNLATPASFVSGGGGYVTSSNDALINRVRELEVSGNREVHTNSFYTLSSGVASALRPNITIPKEDGWEGNPYGGHGLDIYHDGATDRIVGDIQSSLSHLSSRPDTSGVCFEAPSAGLAYQMTHTALAVSDSIANVVGPATSGTLATFGAFASAGYRALANGVGMLQSLSVASGNPLAQTSAAIVPLLEEQTTPAPVVQNESPAPASNESTPAQPVAELPNTLRELPELPPQPQQPLPPQQSQPTPAPIFSMVPGFGGGGGVGAPEVAASTPAIAAVAPTSVSLTIISPTDGAIVATTTFTVSGTADTGADIFVHTSGSVESDVTTIAASGGTWSLDLTLPEGDATIAASASTMQGTSATSSTRVTVDTTAPESPTLTVSECAFSLVIGSCIVPTGDVTAVWDDVPEAVAYRLAVNGTVGTAITATTIVATLSAGTTTLSVIAYDAAGNAAPAPAVEVAALTHPLILNEVGWGGLGSSSAVGGIHAESQWIELKNTTGYDIDLGHVAITRSQGDPITLSGIIPKYQAGRADHFFVVGRPIPAGYNQTNTYGKASLIANFAPLATSSAETLHLVWKGTATTSIDATPDAAACATWCAGAYYDKLGGDVSGKNGLFAPRSMERVTGAADGSLQSSWQTTDSYGTYVPGGAGGEWGTPGNENSRNLPEAGMLCNGGLILTDTSAPGPSVNATNCTYLMRFITGNTYGAKRYGAFFQGDVGSSTVLNGHALGVALASGYTTDSIPLDTLPGEHFFFAMWEDRARPGTNDTKGFTNYFTQSATSPYTPPHGNYVVVPLREGE